MLLSCHCAVLTAFLLTPASRSCLILFHHYSIYIHIFLLSFLCEAVRTHRWKWVKGKKRATLEGNLPTLGCLLTRWFCANSASRASARVMVIVWPRRQQLQQRRRTAKEEEGVRQPQRPLKAPPLQMATTNWSSMRCFTPTPLNMRCWSSWDVGPLDR